MANIGELIASLVVDTSGLSKAEREMIQFGKEIIKEQKEIIRQIENDIRKMQGQVSSLSGKQREEMVQEIRSAKRALAEEKGALIGKQEALTQANEKLKGSMNGMLGVIGKYVAGFVSVGVVVGKAYQWFKTTETGINALNIATRAQTQAFYDMANAMKEIDLFKSPFKVPEVSSLGGVASAVGSSKMEKEVRESIVKLAKEENEIRIQNRQDLVEEARLSQEVRKARLDAYDFEAPLQDRINSMTVAIEKQQELEKYKLADIAKELDLVTRMLAVRKGDEELMQRQAQLQAQQYNEMDKESVRMISYRNTLQKQENQRQKELVEAFTPWSVDIMKEYKSELENINTLSNLLGKEYDANTAKMNLYRKTLEMLVTKGEGAGKEAQEMLRLYNEMQSKLIYIDPLEQYKKRQELTKGEDSDPIRNYMKEQLEADEKLLQDLVKDEPSFLPQMEEARDKIQRMTRGLLDQREAVDILADGFTQLFTGVSGGFQRMIDSIIRSIERLIAETLAQKLVTSFITGGGLFGGGGLINKVPMATASEGAIAYGDSVLRVGEYPGASVNPEVIAPLDKLRNIMGSQQVHVVVEGKISGKDIALALRRS